MQSALISVPSRAQRKPQSVSALAPIGVEAAIHAASNPSITPKPKIFDEFALNDRVAIVSGGNGTLGLEMALALCEAGARAVYCFDLPKVPSEDWKKTQDFVSKLGSRLEYVSVDVTKQGDVWDRCQEIGDKEGRMDCCIAAAGILKCHADSLEYPAEKFQEVLSVNLNGALYIAQAAGRQMVRFGNQGSIILVASMGGSVASQDSASWVAYCSSKAAVLQMARSLACELGIKGIRVNSLSPGYIDSKMTATYLDAHPGLLEKWSAFNPLGRIGRPDELRGVATWLASDASSFCTGSDILVSGGHHAW